jgi:hypothetical protein
LSAKPAQNLQVLPARLPRIGGSLFRSVFHSHKEGPATKPASPMTTATEAVTNRNTAMALHRLSLASLSASRHTAPLLVLSRPRPSMRRCGIPVPPLLRPRSAFDEPSQVVCCRRARARRRVPQLYARAGSPTRDGPVLPPPLYKPVPERLHGRLLLRGGSGGTAMTGPRRRLVVQAPACHVVRYFPYP